MDQTSAKIDEAFPAEISNDRFVRGLDTIRFVCALWVTIGHMGLPALPFLNKSTVVGKVIIGVYHSVFSGASAVIVFFVISGLCIHLPHVQGKAIPDLRVYFTRRYVRIMIPMLAAIGIANHLLSYELSLFEKSILWSLLCELIYYTIYPALLAAATAGLSWRAMAVVSFVLAIIVAATDVSALDYPSYGWRLNWLLGLPCWLLGCVVAEEMKGAGREQRLGDVWIWRAGIWSLSSFLLFLRFHAGIGYPWSLNLFAILAAFWLINEIRWFSRHPPPQAMEWAGRWSYSLYLFHPLAFILFDGLPQPIASPFISWFCKMLFVLVLSFGFAVLFEWPSHRLARRAGNYISATA